MFDCLQQLQDTLFKQKLVKWQNLLINNNFLEKVLYAWLNAPISGRQLRATPLSISLRTQLHWVTNASSIRVIAKSVFSGTGRRLVSLQPHFCRLYLVTSKMSVWSTLSDSSFLEMLDTVLSKCDASYCKLQQKIATADIRFFPNNDKMLSICNVIIGY